LPRRPWGPAAPATTDLAFLGEHERAECDRIVAALDDCAGNQTRTAEKLKIAIYRILRPRARPR
jgi:hypothetical protein